MLMRALGARAASVWSNLTPEEAQQLSTAMHALPENETAEQDALRTYVKAMGTPEITRPQPGGSIWAKLSSKDGPTIANLVQEESPQVIALILSRLEPAAAADSVRALPRTLATEALKRLLNLGDIHPAAVKALELTLEHRLTADSSQQLTGGHEHVARIFDGLDSRSEQALLSSLDGAEPGSGEKIRALMFTFEDLSGLDPASMQTILVNTDRAVLTLALKGASEDVSVTFFKNMTQRASDLLRDEIASTGPVRRSEIEAARAEIIGLARTLIKRGDILSQDADDELIE